MEVSTVVVGYDSDRVGVRTTRSELYPTSRRLPNTGETGSMPEALCRWGILGTANIARKNWKAIGNAGNSTLCGVASRDRNRARRFIDECQAAAPLTPAPI